jgi:tetraprenyl-beta-curcumene synthase
VQTASRYWLDVFPRARVELRHWRAHAAAIPDPTLRRLALTTLLDEGRNLEGAAAFAVLAPRSQQAPVVRATVAFQAIYDYVDTLAEQPGACMATTWQLHLALLRAVEPGQGHPDYYAHGDAGDDGGYLRRLVEGCACALSTLPSWPAVNDAVLAAVVGMASYQALNHGGSVPAMARWARGLTPPGSGLLWWETAAAAASSLTAFALVAAAADARLEPRTVAAIQAAYYPWIGALHILLDSLADRAVDAVTDQPSLIAHYDGEREAAVRMGGIAVRAVHAAARLPDGRRHTLLAAAMSSYYLSLPSVAAGPVGREVKRALRPLDAPTMAVLRTRQVVYRAVSRSPRESTRSPLQARPGGEETNPGSSRIMRAPPSGETSARTEPPCASAIARTIANPRPVPPEERLRAESVR